MRKWRKLYSSLLESSTIGQISDSAFTLFCMLVVAQDDSGYYPWDDTKVIRLIAARPKWNKAKIKVLANELCEKGLAKWSDEGIILKGGEKFNGRPRKTVPLELYERPGCNTDATSMQHGDNKKTSSMQHDDVLDVTQSKSREDKIIPPPYSPPPQEAAAVFRIYENNIGILTETVSEKIKDWLTQVEEAWVVDAIQEAAVQNVRKWSYVEGILRDWKEHGRLEGGKRGRTRNAADRGDNGHVKSRTELMEEEQRRIDAYPGPDSERLPHM